MNISCSICTELFKNSDANQMNITHCGHAFHMACLTRWFAEKKTCPECRRKTTPANVIRVFYNVSSYSDNSVLDVNAGSDVVQLQNENDNLKFKLLEQDVQTKSFQEQMNKLMTENADIKTKQRQTKQIILTLEQKNEQLKILQDTHCDQIRSLKHRLTEIDRLQQCLDEANQKLSAMEAVKQVLHGTQKDTEALLNEKRSPLELATMATALKRELNALEARYKQMRCNKEDVAKDLRRCKDEKLKLEEKCAILESKVFQWENQKMEKENEDSSLTDSSLIEDASDTYIKMNDRFGEMKRRKITVETKTKSPQTFTVASSLAGLSPLFNTAKLSTQQSRSSQEISIFNKPRLIESHSKKSIVRPSRLVPSNSKSEFVTTSDNSKLDSMDEVASAPSNSTYKMRTSYSWLDNASKRVCKPIPK